MRRVNGSGSVGKLSGKRRKPWCVRVTDGYEIVYDADGNACKKLISKHIGTYAYREEAEDALNKYLNGMPIDNSIYAKECNDSEKELKDEPHYVYFVTDGQYTKVGKTNNLKKRLKNIQNGNPRKINVLCTFKFGSAKSAFAIETKIHKMLSKHNVINEWFDIENADEIIKTVREKCEWIPDFEGFE